MTEETKTKYISQEAVEELLEACELANGWFDKLINDADLTPLSINDPLKPILIEVQSKIQQAITKAGGE